MLLFYDYCSDVYMIVSVTKIYASDVLTNLNLTVSIMIFKQKLNDSINSFFANENGLVL